MKKLFLIAIGGLIAMSSFAKHYDDKIEGSFADDDTLMFSTKLRNVALMDVTIILAIKNTDDVDATFAIAGQDNRISVDYNVTHFETITHSALPFTIDTTNVAKTVTGFGYEENGDDYVYYKTITIEKFPHKRIGGYFVLNTTTTGDYTIYITANDNE